MSPQSPILITFLTLLLFTHISSQQEPQDDSISGALRQIANDILNETLYTSNVSIQCQQTLANFYFTTRNISDFYLDKLILDSSVTKNDITSFKSCMTYKHGYNISVDNITYLLAELESKGLSSLYGICVAKGCPIDEYQKLAKQVFLQIFPGETIETENIYLLDINPKNKEYQWEWKYMTYLIPFILMSIFILMSCFNKYIVKKNIKMLSNKDNSIQFNKIKANAKKIFDTKANWIEVFEFNELVNEVNNNSGLTYTKSLRGISMLFLIFGLVLYYIYNSPLVILSEKSVGNLMTHWFYFIFYFGLRYSPKLLLSCSGFSLVYKLISYLDDRVESNAVMKINPENDRRDNDNASEHSHDDSLGQLIKNNVNERARKMEKELSMKLPYLFIVKQVYKYVLLLTFILFINFSLYYVVRFMKDIEPMWEYFKQRIITQYDKTEVFLSLSLISSFNVFGSKTINVFTMFSFVYTEMICFIFTTIFIYIGYKKQLRIDSILLFIITGCFFGRFIYYLFNIKSIPSITYLSSTYFGKFEDTALYNCVFYFLGAYFSLAYYSLQTSTVNYQDADNQQKPYLYIFVKIKRKLKKLKKVTAYGTGIFLLFIGLLLSYVQIIYLHLFKGSEMFMLDTNGAPKEEATNYSFLNIYFLFDCEFATVFIHTSLFIFYSRGDNRFKKVFCHKIWNYFEKIYFSFILVTNPIVLYVIYECETRINFEISQILFYSLITFIVLFIVATITYVLLELPFKRISKLVCTRRNNKNNLDKQIESMTGNLPKFDATSF